MQGTGLENCLFLLDGGVLDHPVSSAADGLVAANALHVGLGHDLFQRLLELVGTLLHLGGHLLIGGDEVLLLCHLQQSHPGAGVVLSSLVNVCGKGLAGLVHLGQVVVQADALHLELLLDVLHLALVGALHQDAGDLALRGVGQLGQDLILGAVQGAGVLAVVDLLADLLTELCRIGGIEWIRLHYAYPTGFPDDVIEVMAHEPKICKYLDIPFQHISDAQLKAMKRRHTKADAYRLVERLRAAVPDIALRTTLLVGYPGETEADFAELLQFVDDVRFDRLGVFAYSEEEGTYSALHLKDDVPDEVKRRRVERIMERQKAISLDNNLRRVGRTERVVVDARQGDYYVCRTQYDSPEVDQEILIPASERRLLRGHFYDVTVTSAADYDLYGEIAAK